MVAGRPRAPMVIVPVTVADPMLALGVAVAKAAEITVASTLKGGFFLEANIKSNN